MYRGWETVTEVKEPARTARRDATRERVLDAAREVFAERGVIGASVEEICERAGFTRGAFYSNFADKADLVDALVAREHARLLAVLDANVALLGDELARASGDPSVLLGTVVDQILAAVPGDRLMSLVQIELEIHAIREPATSASFREADARFRKRIADLFGPGMRLLGRELTVDARDVADAAIAIVERSARRALAEGRPDDPDALARAVLPAFLLSVSRPIEA
jgi:AcrR family transcriptional regulator